MATSAMAYSATGRPHPRVVGHRRACSVRWTVDVTEEPSLPSATPEIVALTAMATEAFAPEEAPAEISAKDDSVDDKDSTSDATESTIGDDNSDGKHETKYSSCDEASAEDSKPKASVAVAILAAKAAAFAEVKNVAGCPSPTWGRRRPGAPGAGASSPVASNIASVLLRFR
mmetsp:Transcript_103948/g.291154  ORF Transcript_103948/g.291154 Transcript_103948/m.291154 type:complete len:172 (+) Transcript_103948:69-584(+)